MQSLGVEQIIADVRDPQPLQERLEFARKYESNLVRLKANVEKLVGYLVEEDNIQVVSMTGMCGLEKTTLARQAFHHDMVKKLFDRLVWVCVTQDCNPINVWQKILRTLSRKEDENKISKMRDATVLHGELFRLLETIKSLIVFDDIWKEEDWDLIKPLFPHKKGSKVLLTSQTERVAGCGETYINFKPECLSDLDSWILFQRIVMLSKDTSELTDVDEEMEEMGKQMIKHCKGLPLAIRVLGGLLAEKYTVHDWKRLYENIGPHLVGRTNDDNNNSFNCVLSLSYEELPCYLKYCFLYLAHFPEDYEMNVEHLSYYWAAEGIFMYDNGESIPDVGHNYIEELVKRNIVISERDNTTLRFGTCVLYKLMRDLCLSKAKEESFLHFIDIPSPTEHSQSLRTLRRIVLQYLDTLDVEREISNPKVRSLMVITKDKRNWDLSSISFTRLQLLRVLYLCGASFNEDIVPHLPYSLQNLKLLIYLNLNIDLNWKCSVPGLMDKNTKLELMHLVNLETIVNFSVENFSLDDLGSMARLRMLGICITGDNSLETLSASIGGWINLFDFSNLKQLGLKIYIPLLSDDLKFPSRLTTLSLRYCCLEEDPMPILEKLIHLIELTFDYKSFSGSRMVCSRGGFPKLQKLQLRGLEELEEWIVEEGTMPLLHTLEIDECSKLKEIPYGLRFITSLKFLRVGYVEEEWKERLSEAVEDYYKIKHIPSVIFKRM